MEMVKGIIINQINRKGTWLQLRDRTWVYVSSPLEFLVGSYGIFEGEKRQGTRGFFLYVHSYTIPEPFNKEAAWQKTLKFLKKQEFKAEHLLQIQTVKDTLTYFFVIGKKTLITRLSKWNNKKIIEYCSNPSLFYLNKHADFFVFQTLSQALMLPPEAMIYPTAVFLVENAFKNGRKESLPIDGLCSLLNERMNLTLDKEELIRIINTSKPAKIIMAEDRVYPVWVYYLRQRCIDILSKNLPSLTIPEGIPEELKSIIKWRYSVLTGDAGTGKSTLVKQLKNSPLKVNFTALTGKAAKRLDETATTLHDFLGFPSWKVKSFDTDVLVIDEASMITWQMLYHTLSKVKGHVIFVGDPEQIAPVEGESIFPVIINSMPPDAVKKLDIVYRTKSVITEIKQMDRKQAVSRIIALACLFEKKNKHWQVVTPLRAVASFLNTKIQDSLHKGEGPFRKGDRVIFLKNLRIDGIFCAGNGQIGTVLGKDGNFYVVQFGDKVINCYPDEISLAYALTLHKAQASEYDYVICYVPAGIREDFITSDLIKVALTRARKKTFVITEDEETLTKIKLCHDIVFGEKIQHLESNICSCK